MNFIITSEIVDRLSQNSTVRDKALAIVGKSSDGPQTRSGRPIVATLKKRPANWLTRER